MTVNHQYRLAARPSGLPKATDWNYVEESVRQPNDGEVLIKVLYLSLDPAMRGWMNEGRSYVPPVQIGEVMRAGGIGKIIASKHADYREGEHVYGTLGIQEYATIKGGDLTKLEVAKVSLPVYLGALGMPGMTAYFGLLDIGKPKAGDTVVVSGAAGAVGTMVGQIAKLKGCRVIGIAGSKAKCEYLTKELGFDAAIDYKTEDVKRTLRAHCPNGIDVYFDNVGGEILEAALAQLARHARIVICGAISQYNSTTGGKGPANYMSLLVNRASMTGMVVFDYTARFPQAIQEMAEWIAAGKLKTREDIVSGIETFPDTLLKLFKGENLGKLVLKVAEA